MTLLSIQILLFTVLCILTTKSEDHHTFSSLTLVRGRKSRDDSIYDSINKFNYSANILKTKDKPLSVSETLETSVRIAPSGSITNSENKPFAYMQLWKGTYPDMLYKRARSGFVGMRGKKDSGFVEFGKKQSSEFFGMRGKKYPYEFRGKFVGVRGKKISHELPDKVNVDLNSWRKELQSNQLMLVLTEQNEPGGV
ncbi:uncharacterized protein LOC108912658 [Anoplophora glabripennis]|nr:uncharacterized protein LOC108912658 [Anoplophora glabripennis]